MLGPLTIDGSAQVVLHLTDNGGLTEIPVPTGGRRRPARTGRSARRAPGRSDGLGTGTRHPPTQGHAAAEGRRGHANPRPRPPTNRPEIAPRRREQTDGFGSRRHWAPARSAAPTSSSSRSRTDAAAGSRVAGSPIWKTIAGKAIGVRTAQALLKKGRSPLLKGFRSKAGKPLRGSTEAGRGRGPVRLRRRQSPQARHLARQIPSDDGASMPTIAEGNWLRGCCPSTVSSN